MHGLSLLIYQATNHPNALFQSPAFIRWLDYLQTSRKPCSVFASLCQYSQPDSDNHAVNEKSSAHHATDRTLHGHQDILTTRNFLHFLRHPFILPYHTAPISLRCPCSFSHHPPPNTGLFLHTSTVRKGWRLGANVKSLGNSLRKFLIRTVYIFCALNVFCTF